MTWRRRVWSPGARWWRTRYTEQHHIIISNSSIIVLHTCVVMYGYMQKRRFSHVFKIMSKGVLIVDKSQETRGPVGSKNRQKIAKSGGNGQNGSKLKDLKNRLCL